MFGLIRLIVLVVALGALYWAYYVFGAPDPANRLGVEINRMLPEPIRGYACTQLKARFGGAIVPPGCEDAPLAK